MFDYMDDILNLQRAGKNYVLNQYFVLLKIFKTNLNRKVVIFILFILSQIRDRRSCVERYRIKKKKNNGKKFLYSSIRLFGLVKVKLDDF